MTTQNNIHKKLLIGTLALLTAGNVFSQQEKSSVLTNSFWDNWEVAVGVEHLSFYSGREDGLNNAQTLELLSLLISGLHLSLVCEPRLTATGVRLFLT